MDKILRATFAFLFSVLLLSPTFLFAQQDPLYDAPGFDRNRETFSSMPNEHIDTFTGGLILSFEDLRLPGNGGLDLVIQRAYNSKNSCNVWGYYSGSWSCTSKDENTWLGYGWTLHFGRLFYKPFMQQKTPVVELSDGSRHAAYNPVSGSKYITKDYWLLDLSANPPVLTLANGTKMYFGQIGLGNHPDFPSINGWYEYLVTSIQDVNNNTIDIHYSGSPHTNEIDYVIDSVGRRIEFTVTTTSNDARILSSISGAGITITYNHQPLPSQGEALLTQVNQPAGNPWRYGYDQATYELTQLTTPSGGVINYSYDTVEVNMGWSFQYRVVVQKTTSGSVPAGTWTFAYSQGSYKDYTQVNDPCERTFRYTYYGYGSQLASGSMWKLGLQKSTVIVNEETTNYEWTSSPYISQDDYTVPYVGTDQYIYVPYLTQKSITRDGRTYTTNYSSYDNYGNPGSISETGDKTRNRSISYWYSTSKNIMQNKPLSEALSGDFPGSFTASYSYDSNGKVTQVDRYGTATNYTYDSYGNLNRVTDANGHWIDYDWDKGRISRINYNSVYSVTRVISDNGTVASETNGKGHTTYFTYDGNLRLLTIDPPAGNTTSFYYPADNSYKKETRGQYYIYHYLDGFGRPSGTSDSKGINTAILYKNCGLKDYTTSNIGDTIYYDNFGRVDQIIHQDSQDINYSYSGSNVTVIDEAGHNTLFTYNAFGNPDEELLIRAQDAMSNITDYGRNILGSLTSITQDSITRTFGYDSRNFLTSETHPEKGTTTYGRDNVGNLTSKTDGKGQKTYAHDALNRLTGINPGSISLTYDNANNRTGMVSSSANISYTFDAANRLTDKHETILGVEYTTQYGYDGNDNVTSIDYPSGRHVTYSYNGNNQVTSIAGFGANVNTVTYYAGGSSTGLPHSFTTSNGLTTNISYNNRNLTTDLATESALHIGYGYDTRGNTTSITNYFYTSKNQTFGYDNLNRLTSFNGSWCEGYCTGSFSYDSKGNRTNKTIGGVPTAYTYNSSTNRLSSTSGGEPFTFTYNTDGDVTAMTIDGISYELEYDAHHNLISYDHNGSPVAEFTYDGDGMRVTKILAGRTMIYHYDKEGRVLSENNSARDFKIDHIYLNGKLAAKVVDDSVVPTNPTSCMEIHGAPNDTWQSSVGDPAFTWSGAADNGSGVKGYYWYFGTDPNAAPTIWTTTAGCDPSAVTSGTYYLRVKTEDNVDNQSTPVTLFTFKYDSSIPINPTICAETHGVTDNTWQNSVSDPAFAWSGASDGGAGVKGYYWYFGTDSNADPTTWTATAGCDPSSVSSGTYYLRVKTEDNAGNRSSPVALFTFNYDGVSPTTTASPPGGTYTSVQSVTLFCNDFQTECGETYYTTDGTDPNPSSSVYTGTPIDIWRTTTLKFFSKDLAGNQESVKTEVYTMQSDLTIAVVNASDNTIKWGYWHPGGPPSGTFSGFYDIGATSTHYPAMAVFNDHQYMAFKGNTNNNIYFGSQDHQRNWSGWSTLSGGTSASPALSAFNNHLYIAVKGTTDNGIYVLGMDIFGNWDGSWTTFPFGVTSHAPALTPFNGRLYLFVKGNTNNNIYYYYLDSSGSWSSYYQVPTGGTGKSPAVITFNNRLYVFVKGASNNNIYFCYLDTSGTWSSWFMLSGQTPEAESLAVTLDDYRLYVAVKGNSNNNVYVRSMNISGSWDSSWTMISANTAQTPVINAFAITLP